MLDGFIIEELRRREREERDAERPRLDLPLNEPQGGEDRPASDEDDDQPERGVVIINL